MSKNFENPLQNSVKHFISGFYIFTKIKNNLLTLLKYKAMNKIFFILLFFIFGKLSATNPDDLLGTWMSTDNSVKVEVYKVNNQFKAKVLGLIIF